MKVLITGGAGFIGSHLAERHLQRGDEVYCLDDLSTGAIENILHLKADPNFNYIIDTITNYRLVAELVDLCDVIYHLAAAVGVRLIVESPVRTIETNIRGTEIVLGLAAKKQRRILITSTSEVYGKLDRVPFKEDDDLVMGPTSKGRWSYACSKAIDEFLAFLHLTFEDATEIRLFADDVRRQNEQEVRLALGDVRVPKERSEHVMLVDLSRNDLGRVCEIGSVRVPRYAAVEKFSHVQHLVSEVAGTLADGAGAAEALASCFPAGTLTGAPKSTCSNRAGRESVRLFFVSEAK